jgi:uncharacterized protein
VLMAKAPVMGRVKTRLAREIGAVAALRFHRRTTERLIRRLGRDRRWELVVAMTPGPRFRARFVHTNSSLVMPAKAGIHRRRWTPAFAGVTSGSVMGTSSRAHLVPQGSGDLGVRMRRPLVAFPPGPVVIIGSDIPGVTRDHIAAAFRVLGARDFVFGPATDGGYWLVGARRRPLPAALFRNVRWSTSHALADTLAGIARRFSVGYVATLEDVDDAASFRRASGAPGGAA